MIKLFKAFYISAGILFLSISNTAFALGPGEQYDTRPTSTFLQSQTGKIKSCLAKEKTIKKRSEKLVEFSSNMEDKFASISARVQEYYTTKVLVSGKSVADYDVLVSDIDTQKTTVQALVAKAQTDAETFNCDSGDPKGQMMVFKDDMKAVKEGLKEYRTSIKNLIVAIHSVTGEENSADMSPKPSHGSRPTKQPKKGEINNGKQK